MEVMFVAEPVVAVWTTDAETDDEDEYCSVFLAEVDDFLNLAVTVIDLFIFTTQVRSLCNCLRSNRKKNNRNRGGRQSNRRNRAGIVAFFAIRAAVYLAVVAGYRAFA